MKRVYVAGPYTQGDVAVNVRAAMCAGTMILDLGHAPYIPHLMHFVHMIYPKPYEVWMKLDAHWINYCDAMLRLPGESVGADREVGFAKALGIPVFESIEALEKWLKARPVKR